MSKIMKNCLIIFICFSFFTPFIIIKSDTASAASYDGEDLALAILADPSTYIDSSYDERLSNTQYQSVIETELGTMSPTDGDTFIILSTGYAGTNIVTTDAEDPGDERGTFFSNKYGSPRDFVELEIELEVPHHMHSLYYDFQFFSTEYPEYVGSQYNDKFTVTVESPSKGTTTYTCDVNNGNFVLDSSYITGTGFDIFAQSGDPNNVDIVDRNVSELGADAGATSLTTKGGSLHPVSPQEDITITFRIEDAGDNQFDSAVFIDNLMFSGYAKTDVIATKRATDQNLPPYECDDVVEYDIVISNVGNLNQNDNPGNEFEDVIADGLTYINDSAYASNGTISYNESERKIQWNGQILKESSLLISYQVTIDSDVENGTVIPNQGTVFWDSNEDGINDITELTDDSSIDDEIDTDGDNETDDDDPTNITVIAFTPATTATEDFSDDTEGESATQEYYGRQWFETNNESFGNKFEVVDDYHYSTNKGFKTQIRASNPIQYWTYDLTQLENSLDAWEVMFACENASEAYDLNLTLKDGTGSSIAKIKLQYIKKGQYLPTDWLLRVYYYNPSLGWVRLGSGYYGDYFYKGWYKIRIEKISETQLNYSVYQGADELVDYETSNKLTGYLQNLAQITFTSTRDALNCPIFIWDEHKLELS